MSTSPGSALTELIALLPVRLLARLDNLRREMLLGISTRGIVAVDKDDACHYASIDYALIEAALGALDLRPDDVFVDIGCGKGRVLCCAARRRLAAVVGVEYSAELGAMAEANAARLRSPKTSIVVHRGAAEDFDYSGVSAIFMFNPFGPATLDAVLAKMRDDAVRAVRLAFVNPSAAQDAVFAWRGWKPYQRFDMADHAVALLESP